MFAAIYQFHEYPSCMTEGTGVHLIVRNLENSVVLLLTPPPLASAIHNGSYGRCRSSARAHQALPPHSPHRLLAIVARAEMPRDVTVGAAAASGCCNGGGNSTRENYPAAVSWSSSGHVWRRHPAGSGWLPPPSASGLL
ncbi:hypothetical protein Vretimale_7403 [Volvox reticuliferus]|uniref:Uncharacterized protein n=1 Tax=Volvox reticuliferus TaxID=1737510 RepID=A0A8J4G943_9CHLO|nr:hypothetical protein Vretimale_7403 [Volvox reticuliferus]